MLVQQLKPNVTEIRMKTGVILLFSYHDPVAAFVPRVGIIVTDAPKSKTSGLHIENWVNGRSQKIVPQEYLEALADGYPLPWSISQGVRQ